MQSVKRVAGIPQLDAPREPSENGSRPVPAHDENGAPGRCATRSDTLPSALSPCRPRLPTTTRSADCDSSTRAATGCSSTASAAGARSCTRARSTSLPCVAATTRSGRRNLAASSAAAAKAASAASEPSIPTTIVAGKNSRIGWRPCDQDGAGRIMEQLAGDAADHDLDRPVMTVRPERDQRAPGSPDLAEQRRGHVSCSRDTCARARPGCASLRRAPPPLRAGTGWRTGARRTRPRVPLREGRRQRLRSRSPVSARRPAWRQASRPVPFRRPRRRHDRRLDRPVPGSACPSVLSVLLIARPVVVRCSTWAKGARTIHLGGGLQRRQASCRALPGGLVRTRRGRDHGSRQCATSCSTT